MVCAWVASLADFLLARQHSRPQSPSFLLVEWTCPLQIKPSGSGNENGWLVTQSFPTSTDLREEGTRDKAGTSA